MDLCEKSCNGGDDRDNHRIPDVGLMGDSRRPGAVVEMVYGSATMSREEMLGAMVV